MTLIEPYPLQVKDCVQLLHLWLTKRELESRQVKDRDFKGVDIRELDLLPSFYHWCEYMANHYNHIQTFSIAGRVARYLRITPMLAKWSTKTRLNIPAILVITRTFHSMVFVIIRHNSSFFDDVMELKRELRNQKKLSAVVTGQPLSYPQLLASRKI